MTARARSAGRPVSEIHRPAGEPCKPHPRCAGRVRPPGRPVCCGERGATSAPCYALHTGEQRHPPHPMFVRAANWFDAIRAARADGAGLADAFARVQ